MKSSKLLSSYFNKNKEVTDYNIKTIQYLISSIILIWKLVIFQFFYKMLFGDRLDKLATLMLSKKRNQSYFCIGIGLNKLLIKGLFKIRF